MDIKKLGNNRILFLDGNRIRFSISGQCSAYLDDNQEDIVIKEDGTTYSFVAEEVENIDSGGGLVPFSGNANTLLTELNENFFKASSGGGGGGGDQIIKGSTPPSDTSKFWFNTTLGFTFYYESGVNRWLSDQNYVQNFSANGNLNNNGFFKIDNVRLTADRGIVTPYASSLAFFTWYQSTDVTGDAVVYSQGNVIKSIAVSGLQGAALVPDFPIINEFETISLQWQGLQTSNFVGYLSYKITYIP